MTTARTRASQAVTVPTEEGRASRVLELLNQGQADEGMYRTHTIPKVDSAGRVVGKRKLIIPNDDLKAAQNVILDELYGSSIGASPYSHAFHRNRSIMTMAKPHVGNNYALTIDIKDYFPSVTPETVIAELEEAEVNAALISRVRRLCFYRGGLPQGAPTSPFLSNVAGNKIDYAVASFVQKWRVGLIREDHRGNRTSQVQQRPYGLIYTRYADDLAFSAPYKKVWQLKFAITRILEGLGYKVNPRKITEHKKGSQIKVCGLVVNEVLNAPRKRRRGLRGLMHRAICDRAKGRTEPGFVTTRDGHIRAIDFMQLRGEISFCLSANDRHRDELLGLFHVMHDVHTLPQELWSPATNQYVSQHAQH